MIKKMQWGWEELDAFTSRSKVIGGWIVRCQKEGSKSSLAESMVFLPDRDHEWTITQPRVDVKVERSNIAKDFEVPK